MFAFASSEKNVNSLGSCDSSRYVLRKIEFLLRTFVSPITKNKLGVIETNLSILSESSNSSIIS